MALTSVWKKLLIFLSNLGELVYICKTNFNPKLELLSLAVLFEDVMNW